jgi:hypothetical protein
MRAFFLLLGLCAVIAGVVIFQTQPAFLGGAVIIAKVHIPNFAFVIAAAVIGVLITILAIVSLVRALGKEPRKLWYIAEIVIGLAVAAALYFVPEKQIDEVCVAAGDYGPYCLKSYLYYGLWAAAVLPLLFGLLGVLRAMFFAVKNSGVVAAAADALRSNPPPSCQPGSENCPPPAAPSEPLQIKLALPGNIVQLAMTGAGALLALFLLIFVSHERLFGGLCFYVGSLTLDGCFSIWFYIFLWLVAVGLIVAGLFGPHMLTAIKRQK